MANKPWHRLCLLDPVMVTLEKNITHEGEGVLLKPDSSPVDPQALYLQGLAVAGIDEAGSCLCLGSIRGEGFASDNVKEAHLHTLHITRMLFG